MDEVQRPTQSVEEVVEEAVEETATEEEKRTSRWIKGKGRGKA